MVSATNTSPVLGRADAGIGPHLDLLIRARYPLIFLATPEEHPAEELLQQLGKAMNPVREVLFWDMVQGWEDNGQNKDAYMPALMRVMTVKDDRPTIFVFRDYLPVLQNPQRQGNYAIVRALKKIAQVCRRSRKSVVFLGHQASVPVELREEMVVVDFPLPSTREIDAILSHAVPADKLQLQGLGREQLVRACQGLTRYRIERILARALASKGMVTEADVDLVLDEKKQYVRQTGILEFYNPMQSLKSVGGLENLKAWVQQRRNSFSEQAQRYGLPNPKGVLLVGIQGTGKSLSAKTIAREWKMPLLKLDVGRLFGGIVGESESNVRAMTQIAEAMAPCVLWIDEIDKAFGGVGGESSGDSGTSKRVFGSLITWMQEKSAPVFVVATANNVRVLPAELLRKGRFDEIFFINLPSQSERQAIFRVHLERVRANRIRDFDLGGLAAVTEEFSGAEIEQCIYDAMHLAFNQQTPREFAQQDLEETISQTVPLAAIARDQIQDLKRWAVESGARTASQDEGLQEELKEIATSVQRGLSPIEVDGPSQF